jgi:hypothetical protein
VLLLKLLTCSEITAKAPSNTLVAYTALSYFVPKIHHTRPPAYSEALYETRGKETAVANACASYSFLHTTPIYRLRHSTFLQDCGGVTDATSNMFPALSGTGTGIARSCQVNVI